MKMVQLCTTKYSNYANNYNNCAKEQIEGCEGCEWYVPVRILKMFEYFEEHGFPE